MNISAFGATWSQVALLREASGYQLSEAADPQEKEAAKQYCAGVDSWPALQSVTVRAEVAYVCFGPHQSP
jgi:hypothetical protein